MQKTFRKLGYFFLYALVILAFIYLGTKDYNLVTYATDGERFNGDYNEIPRNNPFVYLNSTELIELLNNGSGIVFMGNKENIWSKSYAKYLYEIASSLGLKEIYYNIINALEGKLIETDDSVNNLFSPSLYILKDGEVVFYDNTTAVVNNDLEVDTYWDSSNIYKFKEKIITAINENDW